MIYQLTCPKTIPCQGDYLSVQWSNVPTSSPFVHSHGRGGACYFTQVQVAWDDDYLYIRFHCQDDQITATLLQRDDPLYNEEVVEVFLAPVSLGQYYEVNLSPRNVIFDSLIKHDGVNAQGDPDWDCHGIKHGVIRRNVTTTIFGDWDGYLAIPFHCLNLSPAAGLILRGNFFRIKRQVEDQYLAWSPTGADPANFHVPSKFGELIFA